MKQQELAETNSPKQPTPMVTPKPTPTPTPTLREAFRTALVSYQQNPKDSQLQISFEEAATKYTSFVLSLALIAPNNFLGNFIKPSREVYDEILYFLKEYPTNATLHIMALEFGRMYYSHGRRNKAPTIYDENAIANDIRAATGAHAMAPMNSILLQPSQTPTGPAQSAKERLDAIAALKDSGHISTEEYESKRAAILNEL